METKVRSELMMLSASKVHEAWCEGELKAFYGRMQENLKDGANVGAALRQACIKGGKKRNEIELDIGWLDGHGVSTYTALQTYDGFKALVDKGVIEVKRFTGRNLTKDEQKKAGTNYNPETQEENILRPFSALSIDSQKENVSAAVSAVTVYEAFLKRGATVEQLKQEDMREAIGTLIHADWMRRNPKTASNSYLYVPYAELGDWEKQQDLDVFFAMLEIVESNPEKYFVDKEFGLTPINVKGVEENVLKKVNAQKEIIC